MCGFAGFCRRNDDNLNFPHRAHEVEHRGPDSSRRVKLGNLDLFFFRLAINGLDNGDQPFVSEEIGLVTAVNGEIYNHLSLRSELEALGARFSTESDAEVVHWGFAKWGTQVFAKLEGMFAVFIYDAPKDQVTFARDRLGKKPLYWMTIERGIQFGSELGSLDIEASSISSRDVHEYFLTDGISWLSRKPKTPQTLRGGSWVQINSDGIHEESFWDPKREAHQRGHKLESRADWLRGFVEVLQESVEDRMMSEVPVGSFLSNGKDSKLVSLLASRTGKLERTFTLKFDVETYDESAGARDFAKLIGVENHPVSAGLHDLGEAWIALKESLDEPYADPAILGELLLAREAATRTKVVLTGDGGDEILLGYQHVRAHLLAEQPLFRTLSGTLLRSLKPLFSEKTDRYFSNGFIVDRFLRGSHLGDLVERDLAWRVNLNPVQIPSLLAHYDTQIVEEIYEEYQNLCRTGSSKADWRDSWVHLYLSSYLPMVILKKVDRATMRYGVEARSPLLDRKVVEFSLAMPHKMKSTLFQQKLPVAFALKSLLGEESVPSRKHGMGIPLATLLRGPLAGDVQRLDDREMIYFQGIFNYGGVRDLLSRFFEAPSREARAIWSLLVFQNWWAKRFWSESKGMDGLG